MNEDLQRALTLLTYETVRERSTAGALRLHGRVANVDTFVTAALLISDRWVVDVSYHFFAEAGESGRADLRVGWRLVIQPRTGATLEEAVQAFAKDVCDRLDPPVADTAYEVTEVPLLNTPPNRNAPNERGKGALYNTEVPLGVRVSRERRSRA